MTKDKTGSRKRYARLVERAAELNHRVGLVVLAAPDSLDDDFVVVALGPIDSADVENGDLSAQLDQIEKFLDSPAALEGAKRAEDRMALANEITLLTEELQSKSRRRDALTLSLGQAPEPMAAALVEKIMAATLATRISSLAELVRDEPTDDASSEMRRAVRVDLEEILTGQALAREGAAASTDPE